MNSNSLLLSTVNLMLSFDFSVIFLLLLLLYFSHFSFFFGGGVGGMKASLFGWNVAMYLKKPEMTTNK